MRRVGRKSMIGGMVALSMILTGTGYAYWTDTLNVTTKATTGDFAVTFADMGLYAQYGNETIDGGWSIVDGIGESAFVDDDFFMRDKAYNKIAKDGSIEGYAERAEGYNNINFDAELVDATAIAKNVGEYTTANTLGSDRIELTVNNMYPGYAQAFRTDILNVGDIAAKLSDLKFTVANLDDAADAAAAKDMLGIAVLINQEMYQPSPNDIDDKNVFQLCAVLADENNYFTVGGVDFLRLSALDDVNVAEAIENANILCSPATDNRMDFYLAVAMDKDEEGVYTTGIAEAINDKNDDADSQKKGVKISIDFLWDQFNAGKDTETPNILVNQNVPQ